MTIDYKNQLVGIQPNGKSVYLKDVQAIQLEILKEVHRVCVLHKIPHFLEGGTLLGAIRHDGFIPWDDDVDIAIMQEHYDQLIEALKTSLGEAYSFYSVSTDKKFCPYICPIKVRKKGTYAPEPKYSTPNYCKDEGVFIDIFTYDYASPNRLIHRLFIITSSISMVLNACFYTFNIHLKLLKKMHIGLAKMYGRKNKKHQLVSCSIVWVFTPTYRVRYQDIFPTAQHAFEDTYMPVPNQYDTFLSECFGDYMSLPSEKARRMRHVSSKINLEGDRYE